jgi:O-acetylserine/cysteine efflux transporter
VQTGMQQSAQPAVPPLHLLLALAVVAVWGTNFVVIRVALDVLPPLTFATLRYVFALLPAALFIKRPAVRWRSLAAYGAAIGFGQFGLLFIAMDGLISPGLASLVVQMQIFFTIGLAVWLGGERVHRHQLAGLLLAMAGVVVILARTDGTTTPLGLALVLAAALSWGIGNHVARTSGTGDMLGFVVWASLFAIPPLALGALIADGPARIAESIAAAGPGTWAAVLWQSVGNTLFGYSAWGWLLARHPAATISPMSMLVPVFGLSASALLLGEPLQTWKLIAGALVLGGLALNLLWPRLAPDRRATRVDDRSGRSPP